MEDSIVAAVITAIVCLPAGFALGVLFHRQVLSEADTLKAHVTTEVGGLRTEVKTLLDKVAAKV